MVNDRKTALWRGFGKYLKEARERLHYSQEGAARQVDLTRQQWNRLENGLSGTKRETVVKIAEVFGLNETEALNKAGFDTPKDVMPSRKPTNVAEFFESLDELGLDIQFDGGYKTLENLDEDDLQELLDGLIANTIAKARRKSKSKNME